MCSINYCHTYIGSALPRSQIPPFEKVKKHMRALGTSLDSAPIHSSNFNFSILRTQGHGEYTSHVDEDVMGCNGSDTVLYLYIRADWHATVCGGVT